MIGKPFLILGILAGVSATATAGYFGISALDSKSSQQESQGEGETAVDRTNTQDQTILTPNPGGAVGGAGQAITVPGSSGGEQPAA